MTRTSAKDVFDLQDELLDQEALSKNLRLQFIKRNSYMRLNGLGSSLANRKEHKMRLLAHLKTSGLWGSDE